MSHTALTALVVNDAAPQAPEERHSAPMRRNTRVKIKVGDHATGLSRVTRSTAIATTSDEDLEGENSDELSSGGGDVDLCQRGTRKGKTWAAPKVAHLMSELSTPSSVAGSPLGTVLSTPEGTTVLSTPEQVTPDGAMTGQMQLDNLEDRVSPTGSAATARSARVSPNSDSGAARISPSGRSMSSPSAVGSAITRKCFKAGHNEDLGWRKGGCLGRGSYGTVYRALDRGNGRIFAVKETQLEESSEHDRKLLARLEVELEICRALRHPNIVSYLGHAYQDTHIYIYLEYVAGGSVADLLKEFGPLVGYPLQSAVKGCLEGLNYLHTRSTPVVHRDIKGANILVDLNFHMKLADFGCSKRNAVTQSFTTIGSIPWMAPEVISQQNGYGRKADIWSFGCLVIEMVSAQKPWGMSFDNMMAALAIIGLSQKLPEMPPNASEDCCNFIRRCVVRKAEDRPSAAVLLQDAFLEGIE